MPRVAVIALDSLEWWYLQELVDQGRMPNLARVMERSARFPLETPLAYRTELVWARFVSGKEPLDSKDWAASASFDPNTYRSGRTPATDARPFYALGNDARVVAMDLIHTRPKEGVDGLQVSAWGSHSPQWPRTSRPVGLLTEIDERFGVNPAFNNEFGPGWWDDSFIDALADASVTAVRRRFDACRWMLDRQADWDLFLTCISEFHTTGHQMWHGMDPSHPLYGTVYADHSGRRATDVAMDIDAALGSMLAALPDDVTTVLFSLHGLSPADDVFSTIIMGELFHRLLVNRRGLLRSPDFERWTRGGRPPIVPQAGQYLTDQFADTARQWGRRAVRNVLGRERFNRLPFVEGKELPTPISAMAIPTEPESLPDAIAGDLEKYTSPMAYQPIYWYRRHWPRMPYFTLPTFSDTHIRVNLAGREANGLVARDDYRRALDEAIGHVRACVDVRTGRPFVGDVMLLRADDPFDPEGPDADALIYIDGAPDCVVHPDLGPVGPFAHVRTSQHTGNGFALVSGPGIAPGVHERRPSVDLTPTILSLLGVPDPVGCVGESLLRPVAS